MSELLQQFFRPRGIAVVGASREEGKVGFSVLDNLVKSGFAGGLYPVNPKTREILGLPCVPEVAAIAGPVDLAVIIVPPPAVAPAVEACAARGIHAAVVISAGFKEVGGEGPQLERDLRARARAAGVRLVGPNCLGILDTASRVNATFAAGMPPRGAIAFFSQSGALCTAILDWAMGNEVGFSKFISLGNKADLTEVEWLEALAEDPETRVILGYIEGVEDGARFLEAARRATAVKPVIMMKSGGTAAGARAASSHTGTLAGTDRAYEAAFRQAGILRARTSQSLFDLARAFATQPLPRGPRLGILTNAGGPGIIAADATERSRATMASLAPETVARLREALPPTAAVYNPVDVIGDAREDRYRAGLDLLAADPNVDGVLALSTPQAMTDMAGFAEVVADVAEKADKPVLAAFMGEAHLAGALKIFRSRGVPSYPFPEQAVRAFEAMADRAAFLARTATPPRAFAVDAERARAALAAARAAGRATLADAEARGVMEAYGFATPQSVLARDSYEAAQAADAMGYPVVLKIASPDILHKTDVGGVRAGLRDAGQVALAFGQIVANARRFMPQAQIHGVLVQAMVTGAREVILGLSRDPHFGPLLMFGLGGIYVEVLKDVAFRIAPIGPDDAREMIGEIRTAGLLKGARGEPPADVDAIVDGLLRLSQLVTDFPEIHELDINPLMVRPAGQGAVAIDARIGLGPLEVGAGGQGPGAGR
jgi:acetyltransferase